MRLLKLNNDGGFSLETFSRANIPSYAILSHTWGREDEEVTFRDLVDGTGGKKQGYQKLQFCGDQAKADGLHYFWVDTCCIDKSNNNELTRAINSMFRWYQNATRCYVYLSDVSISTHDGQSDHVEWESAFRNSRWFKRGWTLQELLAPKVVIFYSREHIRLGDKTSLERQIHDVTGITVEALRGRPLPEFEVEVRFSWGAERQTMEEEDMAYSLLGIFNIYLPLIYGEGQSSAVRRLRKEIKESVSLGLHSTITESEPSQMVPFERKPSFTYRESELTRLERLLFQDNQTTEDATTGQSSSSRMTMHLKKVCNCRPLVVQQSSKRIFTGLELFSRIALPHRADCPYSPYQKATKNLGFNFRYISKLVGGTMQASFTLQFGAGDLQISPLFSFRGIPREDSPAFALLDELSCSNVDTAAEYVSLLKQIPMRLRLLFADRKASPTETNVDGETLLLQATHVLYRTIQGLLRAHPHLVSERNMFLRSLCDLGMPLNDQPLAGQSNFLDFVMQHNCHWESASSANIVRELTDLGAEFGQIDWERDWVFYFAFSIRSPDRSFVQGFSPRVGLECMRTISQFAEVCGCTGLQHAILSRSKSKVTSILARDTGAVFHKNLMGQTPLHTAANWPWALKLLLDSDSDVSDADKAGILPLSYACMCECHEAVEMLLAAGSPLSSASRISTVLDDASAISDIQVFTLVATALAQRRIQVLNIARSILPLRELDSILRAREKIPQTDLEEIVEALQRSGVPVDPHYFCLTSCSVYHTNDLHPDNAELLHNLGFSNVDARDDWGLTPLAKAIDGDESNVRMVPWLLSKGADTGHLLEPYSGIDYGFSALHFAAAGIGNHLRSMFHGWEDGHCERSPFQRCNDYGPDAVKATVGSSRTICYDHCNCLCCIKGCSPLALILKSFAPYFSQLRKTRYERRKWSKYRVMVVDWILAIEDLDPSTKRGIGREALRLLLFDEMDLTHTCCRPRMWWIDPPMAYEEALEVRDEEAELIAQFEALQDLAQLEWKGSTMRFSRFFRKFIHDNITIHRREQRVDEGYVQAVRNIGVQLREVSDDDGNEDNDDDSYNGNDSGDDNNNNNNDDVDGSSTISVHPEGFNRTPEIISDQAVKP